MRVSITFTARILPPSVTALLVVLAGAGCAVGPEFRTPEAPSVTRLAPASTHEDARDYVRTLDIPARWWQLFRCRSLDGLVQRAFDENADLEAARAAVAIAAHTANAERGGFFPSVAANADSNLKRPLRGSDAATTGPYTLHAAQLTVSFLPDVFGGRRRRVESLDAETEARHFELEATYLTLSSRIALAAVDEAGLRAEIAAGEASVAIARDVLQMLESRFAAREVSKLDVATEKAVLAQLEQALPPLRKQLATTRDLMTALTGRFAGEGLNERFDLACITMPSELPLTLPSAIVRQRPDVRAAEASMHAATADIGVAIANRLPQFTISGTVGASASAIATIGSLASPLALWTVAGSAAQVLFDGFSSEQRQRAAEAGLQRAAALYRSAVVTAFQNVADVLQAVSADREAQAAARRGSKAAKQNLDLTREMLRLGQVDVQQVQNAQRLHADAEVAMARAEATLRRDVVLLFQALGGGWREDAGAWPAAVVSAGG